MPFFYGVGAGHTYRMILRMLAAENGHLVEQALAAPGAAEHLDADNVRAVLAAVDTTRASAIHAELLLRLVNLGLLADLSQSLPRVSEMPAGALPDRAAADITDSELAARVAVVDSADHLPAGEYRLQDGVGLHRDALNSTGYLLRDGEVVYEFPSDSETFEALCQLASGHSLAAVQRQQSADALDRIRADLLQLHAEGLIAAAAGPAASE